MSKLEDRLKRPSFIPKREEEPQIESTVKPPETHQEPKRINPHQVYKEVVDNPVPKGELKEQVSSGKTLDFSALEKYQIFAQNPKQMRTYLRNQKSVLQEEIRGFTRRKRPKMGLGTIILIGAGVTVALILGMIILTNPSIITNLFKGLFGG